jgi:hypothetical protein
MKDIKLFAFYFPQFHSIPENDLWWGNGFTDWDLVKSAKPLFDNHYQPRVPFNNNYYNPTIEKTINNQINLAKEYGISGFMFYHYWFDGELMLNKPLEVFLNTKDPDFQFCVCWANESWTKSWIGRPDIILKKQTHKNDKELWQRHFNYLLPFFKDSRALKIDGRPVFLIYEPEIVTGTKEMFEFWNEQAKHNELPNFYFIAVKNHEFINDSFLINYDAILKFQPRLAFTSSKYNNFNFRSVFNFLRILPEGFKGFLLKYLNRVQTYSLIDSKKIWQKILQNAYIKISKYPHLKIFESVFYEWDNTARYGNKAKIFNGLTDDDMKRNLSSIIELSKSNGVDIIFYNAWNEWSESAYLEPDLVFGLNKLKLIHKIFNKNASNANATKL